MILVRLCSSASAARPASGVRGEAPAGGFPRLVSVLGKVSSRRDNDLVWVAELAGETWPPPRPALTCWEGGAQAAIC